MTQKANPGRQEPLAAVASCGLADIGVGNEQTIDLPVGALLLNLFADTTTAFNAGTTATMTVDDGTTTFVNAASVAAAGRAAASNLGKYYPSGGTLKVSLAQTGTAATAGQAYVTAEYVVVGRATESFG